MNTRRRTRGQTGTELLLVISVIVLGATAAGYAFVPEFRTGVERLGSDVRRMLSTGQRGRSRAPAALPPPSGAPFRLPGGAGPDAGCASGVVCLPEERSPLGAPLNVCRRGDGC